MQAVYKLGLCLLRQLLGTGVMQAALIEERTLSEGVQTQPEHQEPPQPRKSRLVLPSWLRWLRTWLWEQFEEVLEVRICPLGRCRAQQHPPVLQAQQVLMLLLSPLHGMQEFSPWLKWLILDAILALIVRALAANCEWLVPYFEAIGWL